MALLKSDLEAIKKIVVETVDSRVTKSEAYLKDYVEFAIEKSELKMESRFDKMDHEISEIKSNVSEINRNINDMIETDQKFLEVLSGHENRIVCVETKLGIKTA